MAVSSLARWVLPIVGWGVFVHGAADSTTAGGASAIASHDTFTLVDLHPVHGRTLRDLVNTEIVHARRRQERPFLELGGSGCGVCNALRQHLDARPLSPHVRTAFAGTHIIRVAVEEWPDAQTVFGLADDQRIPVYMALDTAGRVTHVLSVDYWTLRSLDTDTSSTLQRFFRQASY